MSDAGDPVGAETGGDVTPFSDNPDIRKRFGIKQDTASTNHRIVLTQGW
jgi:hypothetical protein